jgi:hypothetical protein
MRRPALGTVVVAGGKGEGAEYDARRAGLDGFGYAAVHEGDAAKAESETGVDTNNDLYERHNAHGDPPLYTNEEGDVRQRDADKREVAA